MFYVEFPPERELTLSERLEIKEREYAESCKQTLHVVREAMMELDFHNLPGMFDLLEEEAEELLDLREAAEARDAAASWEYEDRRLADNGAF